ncbi:MAG: protein kinase [Candidatus Eisenbacteria bacterium]
MPLSPGTKLGSYEIVAPLGAGGMGEVYRARDARLGRDVAIKLLPDTLAHDPERMARFEREAKLLAAVQHAHVATLFGLEEHAGRRVLVMECVEGESLAQRLSRGAVSVSEAVDVCRQIALGLEAAHDAGIVHRDLKPANVQITPGGEVKVLDFGLARGGPVPAGSSSDLSHSPTMSVMGTAAGVILGTAAYMSPEQARGRAVDRRTDVWAFGCVLYECLTGRQVFEGETISDMIARILEREPDWTKLPAETPPALRELLARCLTKDPRQRMRDIGDVRLELERSLTAPVRPMAAPARPRAFMIAGALGLLAGVAVMLAIAKFGAGGPSAKATHFSLTFPKELRVARLFEGGRGEWVVLAASPRESTDTGSRLANYRRRLDSFEFIPLEGTLGINNGALSPDRRWFAFNAPSAGAPGRRRLMRMPIEGHAPAVELGPWEDDWSSVTVLHDGDILMAPFDGHEVTRISTAGKRSKPAALDLGGYRGWLELLQPLPGDRGVLLNLRAYLENGWSFQVGVLDLRSMKVRVLVERGGNARYDDHGHLLFARGADLLAAPFNAGKLEVTGAPVAVMRGLRTGLSYEPAAFSLDQDGNLFFESGGAVANERRMAIIEPDGRVRALSIEARAYKSWLTSSADGNRFVVRATNSDAIDDLWIGEVDPPDIRRRLAMPSADASAPSMSPDGRRVAYQRGGRDSLDGIYLLDVDAQDFGRRIIRPDSASVGYQTTGWSSDGRYLLFQRFQGGKPRDLWCGRFNLAGDSLEALRPLLQSGADESGGAFSADGRWVLYISDESGRSCAYVAPFDPAMRLGAGTRVSPREAEFAHWSRDGTGIVFRDKGAMVSRIPLTLAGRVTSGVATSWFQRETAAIEDFDPVRGGRAIAVLRGPEESNEMKSLDVILGWGRSLPRLMADGRR